MFLSIHPENPSQRQINQVVEVLKSGGVVIFPTDTVYAIGCDVYNSKAFDKLCRIKGIKPQKANFSFLFTDLSHLAEYTKPVSRDVFKLLKNSLPGPYTFILPASNMVPVLFRNNKKTIGIRIPDNRIVQHIIDRLGGPLVSASLHDTGDDIVEYLSDPVEIHEKMGNQVDLVIDGGFGGNIASTVIDCTSDEPVLIREGAGKVEGIKD
jgi:tRNA threonylcarbamoyl adenosine modification protein (Sua5/YciO/YrdC/YwlC family)